MPRRKKIIIEKPKLGRGAIVREDGLPYPIVYYPKPWGSFLAFAKDEDSSPVLCACSKQAVINAVIIRRKINGMLEPDSLIHAPFASVVFPDAIAEQSMKNIEDPFSSITFVDGLCHKCNLKVPSLRCRVYGHNSEFYQYCGQYIDQTYYRFGISPLPYERGFGNFNPITYIENECPEEYARIVRYHNKLWERFWEISVRIDREKAIYHFGREVVESPEFNLSSVWSQLLGVKAEEISEEVANLCHEYSLLKGQINKAKRDIKHKIFNLTKYEFGYMKVNENLNKERRLYQLICELYPNYKVLYQYKDEWLDRLTLDIYIPELKLAFEYQGEQHFIPFDHIGGEWGLEENQL